MAKWEECLHEDSVEAINAILDQIPETLGARAGFIMLLNKIAEGTPEARKEIRFLELLRMHGVDNWEGYEYACDDLNEEYEEEDSDD